MLVEMTQVILQLVFPLLLATGRVKAANVNFTEEADRCFDSSNVSPPVRAPKDFPVRMMTGVSSQRSCSVECGLDTSCVGYEFKPDNLSCIFASSKCHFKHLWAIGAARCRTQTIKDRINANESCAEESESSATNDVIVYNFKTSHLNLMNMTSYQPENIGGVEFTDLGAQFDTGKYFDVKPGGAEPIGNILGHGKNWTIWSRFMLKDTGSGISGIFVTQECGTTNIQNSVYVYASSNRLNTIYMYVQDRKAARKRIENAGVNLVVSPTDWIDLGIVFNSTQFQVYVNGTQYPTTVTYDAAYSYPNVDIGCAWIGKQSTSSINFKGVVRCTGVTLEALNSTQLEESSLKTADRLHTCT